MVGKYDIEVYNNKAHYFLTVKRNITILQGDSASGKTELIVQHSVKTAYKYSKTKLNDYYKAPKVIEKIKHARCFHDYTYFTI
ncbi:hypothetical protein SAMN02910398_02793 [Butyrivibrio sp. YAB3001]|nr:hypothetical protein SAMN02910398_02793 [Butyrivibrio sp. YAB3001]